MGNTSSFEPSSPKKKKPLLNQQNIKSSNQSYQCIQLNDTIYELLTTNQTSCMDSKEGDKNECYVHIWFDDILYENNIQQLNDNLRKGSIIHIGNSILTSCDDFLTPNGYNFLKIELEGNNNKQSMQYIIYSNNNMDKMITMNAILYLLEQSEENQKYDYIFIFNQVHRPEALPTGKEQFDFLVTNLLQSSGTLSIFGMKFTDQQTISLFNLLSQTTTKLDLCNIDFCNFIDIKTRITVDTSINIFDDHSFLNVSRYIQNGQFPFMKELTLSFQIDDGILKAVISIIKMNKVLKRINLTLQYPSLLEDTFIESTFMHPSLSKIVLKYETKWIKYNDKNKEKMAHDRKQHINKIKYTKKIANLIKNNRNIKEFTVKCEPNNNPYDDQMMTSLVNPVLQQNSNNTL